MWQILVNVSSAGKITVWQINVSVADNITEWQISDAREDHGVACLGQINVSLARNKAKMANARKQRHR